MQCPFCHAELQGKRVRRVRMQECGTCRGVWLGPGELEAYRARLSGLAGGHHAILRGFVADAALGSGRCPVCEGGVLRPGRAAGHRLHRCSRCAGTFIPLEEIDAMERRWRFRL